MRKNKLCSNKLNKNENKRNTKLNDKQQQNDLGAQ